MASRRALEAAIPPGSAIGLDTGGDIDRHRRRWSGLVDDDLAEMQSNTKQEALLVVEPIVEARHTLLDIDCRLDCCHG